MDWLEKLWEKLREWVDSLIDALLGNEPQPAPVPVREDSRSSR
ncbi:MAG: hypothetical protein Q6K70_06025 [Thermostichales cyanobacterium DRC_bins_46]